MLFPLNVSLFESNERIKWILCRDMFMLNSCCHSTLFLVKHLMHTRNPLIGSTVVPYFPSIKIPDSHPTEAYNTAIAMF